MDEDDPSTISIQDLLGRGLTRAQWLTFSARPGVPETFLPVTIARCAQNLREADSDQDSGTIKGTHQNPGLIEIFPTIPLGLPRMATDSLVFDRISDVQPMPPPPALLYNSDSGLREPTSPKKTCWDHLFEGALLED